MHLRPNILKLAGVSLAVIGLTTYMFGMADSEVPHRTVTPPEIDDPLPNPYMGWGIWASPRLLGASKASYTLESNTTAFGDDAPLFNWVMVDWDWARLEPKEGEYDWKEFDAVIDYWSRRGKQFVIRIWSTDDAGWAGKADPAPVYPEWLWAKGLRYREYVGEGKIKQREPDYLDPSYDKVYVPAFSKFLSAFAERYDKRGTPIAFIQVTGYGQWVDWATWYSRYRWPSADAQHKVLGNLVDVFAARFQYIRLMMAYMGDWDRSEITGYDEYLYRMGLKEGLAQKCGLMFTGFIAGMQGPTHSKTTMIKYWKESPMLGEGWTYDEFQIGKHGDLAENLDIVREFHTNYFHYYSDSDSYRRSIAKDRAHFEEGLRRGGLGYRLVLKSATWKEHLPAGDLLVIRQQWVNRNVGRLYVQHPLRTYLTDKDGSVKYSEVDFSINQAGWLQDENVQHTSVVHVPRSLPPGDYDVRIALVSLDKARQDAPGGGIRPGPKTDALPAIRLAIDGRDDQGRYKIGTIHITAAH